jgi:hypothetical protein
MHGTQKGKGHQALSLMAFIYAGNHLRSHTLSRAVPSAQRGLTSVFGMGTGGTLAVWSPANLDAGRAARLKLEGAWREVPRSRRAPGCFSRKGSANWHHGHVMDLDEIDWACQFKAC